MMPDGGGFRQFKHAEGWIMAHTASHANWAWFAGEMVSFVSTLRKSRATSIIHSLAPLGERVARNRRFHQPGRDG
jgi:hypothetical protein